MQGDPAGSVFFLQSGSLKHSVTSKQGKEVIVAVLDAGDFFGQGCLAGRRPRGPMGEQRAADWNSGIKEQRYAKSKMQMHFGILWTLTEYLWEAGFCDF
jgi:hypothetical protein